MLTTSVVVRTEVANDEGDLRPDMTNDEAAFPVPLSQVGARHGLVREVRVVALDVLPDVAIRQGGTLDNIAIKKHLVHSRDTVLKSGHLRDAHGSSKDLLHVVELGPVMGVTEPNSCQLIGHGMAQWTITAY